MLYLLDCYMNVYVEHTLTFSIQILNRLSAGACGTFFFSQTLLLRVYIQYIYIVSNRYQYNVVKPRGSRAEH